METSVIISVVVPIYNAERYIRQCIVSIIRQSYKNWELLLVDDGSKDKSGVICDEIASEDGRLRVIHQDNAGELGARATGVRNANGKWLYFVDADDELHPDALTEIAKQIDEDVDMIVHEYDLTGKISRNEYASILLNYKSWTIWGKLIRRDIFDEYVMDVPRCFKVGGDFLTQVKLLRNIKRNIILENKHFYFYNINNPDSVQRSTEKDYEYEKQMVEYVHKCMEWAEEKSLRRDLFLWESGYLYGMIGYGYQIAYHDQWIKTLKSECDLHAQTWRSWVAISSIDNSLLRLIPKVERKAKNILRNIIKRK